MANQKHNNTDDCHGGVGNIVTIVVDSAKHTIEKGKYLVADFKKRMGIGVEKELELVDKCEFKALKDQDPIHITGCMVFISHGRVGCSS